ncbi:MAG: GTP cyclohydrolase I FolE [Bacteroidaceae bacterium]|jgi:GTP cyclohydrolase I|nr:GTP cyclohydrolase I FolE [Bacteroidaceae bacterium]
MDDNKELEEKLEKLEGFVSQQLQVLGEDVTREGLEKTPIRVAKAMHYLTCGYDMDPAEVMKSAIFKEDYSKMVVVKDIDFYSLCEHHMMPFFGKAHVAYIPDGYITGISKIARVVDIYSHRLQVQERLTNQILQSIQDVMHPRGVMVLLEAQHLCMQMRGVQKQGAITTTFDFSGEFEDPENRKEFFRLIKN